MTKLQVKMPNKQIKTKITKKLDRSTNSKALNKTKTISVETTENLFALNQKQAYINRLNFLCQQAVSEGNIRCALQAEKMIGDANGYFKKNNKNPLDLKEMSDEDVSLLIQQLKERHNVNK